MGVGDRSVSVYVWCCTCIGIGSDLWGLGLSEGGMSVGAMGYVVGEGGDTLLVECGDGRGQSIFGSAVVCEGSICIGL